ncbi:MAG: hypothetical protein KDC34_12420 [Saprospiraceae bacterium]|nr:hypothetical protein [Saprospiraceae bacterium]
MLHKFDLLLIFILLGFFIPIESKAVVQIIPDQHVEVQKEAEIQLSKQEARKLNRLEKRLNKRASHKDFSFGVIGLGVLLIVLGALLLVVGVITFSGSFVVGLLAIIIGALLAVVGLFV